MAENINLPNTKPRPLHWPRRPRWNIQRDHSDKATPGKVRDAFGVSPPYSRISASTGSSLAAERAGMKPKTTPIRVEETNAAMIENAE